MIPNTDWLTDGLRQSSWWEEKTRRLEAGEGRFNASLDAIECIEACEYGIEITRSEHVLDLEPGERKAGEGACYKSSDG